MMEPLIHDVEVFLKNAREDRAGLEYLQRLGVEGSLAFVAETEAAYHRALSTLNLSGEEVARITALAHTLARACDMETAEGKEAMAKLVEVGWLMARWYGADAGQ
jgi:hypothetical protein